MAPQPQVHVPGADAAAARGGTGCGRGGGVLAFEDDHLSGFEGERTGFGVSNVLLQHDMLITPPRSLQPANVGFDSDGVLKVIEACTVDIRSLYAIVAHVL